MFQGYRSASVMVMPVRLVKNPTAVQDLREAHDTPSSWLLIASAGLGVRWIDQLVPFQRSASVAPALDPSAVHAILDAHDTPTSAPPIGFGVRWIAQLLPFHRSANVAKVPARSVKNPTAAQDLSDGHDTPLSPLLRAPPGLGVCWIDQRVPCRRCASVTSMSAPLVKNPTAVQNLCDGHETPANWPYVAPVGFGVR